MKYKDYYAILGVDRKAGADDIKKAYRKLRRSTTRREQGEGAEEKFKEIAEAYQTLKDPEKRAAYDQLGSGYQPGRTSGRRRTGSAVPDRRGGRRSFSFEDLDLSELFEQFRRAAAPARPTGRFPARITRSPSTDPRGRAGRHAAWT
jgi:curved DNA-binding protein